MKVISEDRLKQFMDSVRYAEADLNHKDELLSQIYNDMEQEMTLIGATGVEDKL